MRREFALQGKAIFVAALFLVAAPIVARAGTATSGTLYFDTLNTTIPILRPTGPATVQSVSYTYDGSSNFMLSTPSLIFNDSANSNRNTWNADGLIFAPNGNLLVGGSTSQLIWQVTTGGSLVGTASVGGSLPNHLSLSPDGSTIYSGGVSGDSPGPLGITPLSPTFANGTSNNVTGSVTGITQLAFVNGTAYYTSSPDTGTGNFGTINLSTFVTTQAIANLTAAHGIAFDPYTGDLILAGGTGTSSHVTQINPSNFQIVSDLVVPFSVTMLDQIAVDGKGHLFVTDNGNFAGNLPAGIPGQLFFLDYSQSKLVNSVSNFSAITTMPLGLDDIAPLSGLGSIPEPASLAFLCFGAFALLRCRRINRAV